GRSRAWPQSRCAARAYADRGTSQSDRGLCLSGRGSLAAGESSAMRRAVGLRDLKARLRLNALGRLGFKVIPRAFVAKHRGAPHGASAATVSIHVHNLSQLFNSLDPSPFWDRDPDGATLVIGETRSALVSRYTRSE